MKSDNYHIFGIAPSNRVFGLALRFDFDIGRVPSKIIKLVATIVFAFFCLRLFHLPIQNRLAKAAII